MWAQDPVLFPSCIQATTHRVQFTISFIFKKANVRKNRYRISSKTIEVKWKISEDVKLMFGEIYNQKCEEYEGGEATGAYTTGDL